MSSSLLPGLIDPEAEFSSVTIRWLDQADLGERKSLGQYMTPRPIREALLDRVELAPGMRVLDPGAGTGEFLASVARREPEADLTGWDIDPVVLGHAASNVPSARLEVRSFLEPTEEPRFDLVIGNPPYFQFRATADEKHRFRGVISGRPNIFALFFQAAFESVKPGGQIAFVVPPSMNNGAYFEALREFILGHGRIEHLELLDGNDHFDGANTAAQLIVIRAGETGPGFHLSRSCPESGFRRTIFSQRPELIEREFAGRSTLWQLGYEAVTGTVVWNRHKPALARGPERGAVPLLQSHNVQPGKLVLDEGHSRPQYIRGEPLTGPALIANRVVGAVGRGEMRVAPVPPGMGFLAENHVNVIRRRKDAEPALGWDGLLDAITRPEVAARIRLLTGNTQISATELTHLLPLDHPAVGSLQPRL